MFIKIKAQSSDLEREYIRDRNIFRKKRKTPKLFFTVLLLAGIAGYFYYLNSGIRLQTDQTAIADFEQTSDVIPVTTIGQTETGPNSTEAADKVVAVKEINQESQLITKAIASDEFEQLESIKTDDTQGITVELTTDIKVAGIEANEKLVTNETLSDEESNRVEQQYVQQLTEIEAKDTDQEPSNSELVSKENSQQSVDESVQVADDSVADEESDQTEQLEPPQLVEIEIKNTDFEEINSVMLVENPHNSIEATNQTIDNETPDEKPLTEEVTQINGTLDTEVVNDTTVEISKDDYNESSQHIRNTDSLVVENPAEIADETLVLTDTGLINQITESNNSSINAISKMISNVFTKKGGQQEFVADVVEIDLAEVANTEQDKKWVAITTVTDSIESDYQGSSEEMLSESDYQSISSDNLGIIDEVISTEIRENNVTEIIEQEEQPDSEPESISNSANETVIIENNNSYEPASSKSKITLEELYDQLMADLDQKEQLAKIDNETTTAETETGEITVKEIYNQTRQTGNKTENTSKNTLQTQIDNTSGTESTIREPIIAAKVKIDPDKSLALVNDNDAKLKSGSVEDLVINSSVNRVTQAEATIDEPKLIIEPKEKVVAYVNSKRLTDNKGSTPLMIAVLHSDDQTVRELVTRGTRINERNDWGWTALLNATIKGNHPIVEYLLRNGASPHLADNDGRSPLMAAVLNNHPQIVKTLLAYNADVNKTNRDGWTALSFAAWKGDATSVKYLLEASALKQHQTVDGFTPLQLARQGDHTEVISLLTQ